MLIAACVGFLCCLFQAGPAAAQANYDEAKVPPYTLPDPLVYADGSGVKDAADWNSRRRPELIKIFESEVYGRMPGRTGKERFELESVDRQALGGKATRKEVTAYLLGSKTGPKMRISLYAPNEAARPVPAFVGLNAEGDRALSSRTVDWPVELIVSDGYALATAYYGDVEPDTADGWRTGIRGALATGGAKGGFAPDDWGAIGAWAWGLSRMMDYLETDRDIDAKRVAVVGHSRLGKAALWAGATDTRFALVISNESGCGGAALSKRVFGETVRHINSSYPHWFDGNFKKYDENEKDLPVDQHELIALIAPRPVYVASAAEDKWDDPRGEFLAAKNAGPVYGLFGFDGLGVGDMPGVDAPVGGFIGYHVRSGNHGLKRYDWERYLAFADRHFGRPASRPGR